MKKLILGTIFFAATMVSYSEVKDELNLLKDTEKAEIEKKIEAIKTETGTTVYVTTLPEGESFIPAAMEKVVVINFNKEKDTADKISLQLKFTPDLNIESREEEINEILENNAHLIESGKNSEYTLALLEGMGEFFKEKITEEAEVASEMVVPEEEKEENNQPIEIEETIIEESVPEKGTDYKKYIIGAMAVVIFLGIIKITANVRRIIRKNNKKQGKKQS